MSPIKARNTAAQATTISATTPVTVSGVSLPLASGSNYYFRFQIPFTVKTLAGGVTVGVTGPAMTGFVSRIALPTGGTALATVYTFGTLGTIGGNISNASAALSAVTLMAGVEGFANPSAGGSLHVVISPTATGSQVGLVVRQGALGVAWKLS